MSAYKPSDGYYSGFVTASPATGAATNADALPVATADFSGPGAGSMPLTVTNLDTGRYRITGMIPPGRVKGDVLVVSVAATVGGVAGKAIVGSHVLDAKRVGDLNDSPYNGGAVAGVAAPVTVGTVNDKAGYSLAAAPPTAAQVAAAILATPSVPLRTVPGGYVQVDMAQAVPASNAAQTVGDALNAARAQGFGAWKIIGTQLIIYAADGATVVRAFTLDSADAPTSRT